MILPSVARFRKASWPNFITKKTAKSEKQSETLKSTENLICLCQFFACNIYLQSEATDSKNVSLAQLRTMRSYAKPFTIVVAANACKCVLVKVAKDSNKNFFTTHYSIPISLTLS